MIEVTDLTKRYGDHVAVDRLTFKVEKGQVYGFLGPNGAGKSTTMNIITGYLAPSDGTVTIDGVDIQKDPETAKAKVGYLPELPPLYVDMTVGEYLAFVAELKKIPKGDRKDKIREVCEMTQIGDMENRLIRNLSKGYRQRVGMAQAILGDPEILILDEPTVGLDPKQIIEIRDLIRKLGETHTVILSSHILSEVSAVCDKVMIISHGQLVACDTPEGLEGLMTGSSELNLTIKGDVPRAVAALQCLEGVEQVSVTAEGSESLLIVTCSAGADIREQAFFALADLKIPILEMKTNRKTLEDIFLELTSDDGAAKAKKVREKKLHLPLKKKADKKPDNTPDMEEKVPPEAAGETAAHETQKEDPEA